MSGGPRLCWIGLRPSRGTPVRVVQSAFAVAGRGLDGDHQRQSGLRPWRRREITLVFEADRIAAEAALGRPVPAERLRRNLLVEGACPAVWTRGTRLRLCSALLQVTVPVAPCRRMDDALGPGAQAALKGRGGVAVRVLEGGTVCVGDRFELV